MSYKEHQIRAADSLKGSPGVLVYHGLGSGKTLTSILAAEREGGATVVVPASLRDNYAKELSKADAKGEYDIMSYEKFVRGNPDTKNLIIVDEAHRLKNSSTKRSQALRSSSRGKSMLLTGTPIQNYPHELAPLINMVSGESRLPLTKREFDDAYVKNTVIRPGILDRIFRGAKSSSEKSIKNREDLLDKIKGLVDYHEDSSDGYPSTEEHVVKTVMSAEQERAYRQVERNLSRAARYALQRGLPADKKSSSSINAFSNAVRQVSNTETRYTTDEAAPSPKIEAIVDNISKSKKPSVVYSNYIDSGIASLGERLDREGISSEMFTGSTGEKEKKRIVDKYNRGELDVLLISSSGGEGLDLKNTRQMHIMEPHWNDAKIRQVIGRAARYKSHEALPEEEQKVDVYKYVSMLPERRGLTFGRKNKGSIDEYLYLMSARKNNLNEQFLDVLRESSKKKEQSPK